jgi:hypothetical protein
VIAVHPLDPRHHGLEHVAHHLIADLLGAGADLTTCLLADRRVDQHIRALPVAADHSAPEATGGWSGEFHSPDWSVGIVVGEYSFCMNAKDCAVVL